MAGPTAKSIDLKKAEAWRRGLLRWKLDDLQRKVYDKIKTVTGSFYFNKPRRIGGSYMLLVMAVELCLSKPNAQVKYAAPTAKNVRKIIMPNLRKILEDCPKELRPKWSLIENEWTFPNGSTLAVAGCDNQQYESLRGTEADAIFMDEVGFMGELDYILNDVLMPQIQDTNGYIVMASTPPRSPAHESYKIAMAHKAANRFFTCTVWDNARRTHDQLKAFFAQMAEAKGQGMDEFYNSTTFRREYMAEFVTDEERSVIPEWSPEVEEYLTRHVRVPRHCHKYVAMDPGWKDGMAVLFGYWDHNMGKLVIQDEYLAFKKTVDQVVDAVRSKELELWEKEEPFLRISDNNLQFIADLNSKGLTFMPTKKDQKELQVNNVREWIRARKIIINPRCKRLLVQLGTTIWNGARTSYERNSEGHGDLLDALVYLVRNVRQGAKPRVSIADPGFDVFSTMLEAEIEEPKTQRLIDHFSQVNFASFGEPN